jgi:hypothetical protein
MMRRCSGTRWAAVVVAAGTAGLASTVLAESPISPDRAPDRSGGYGAYPSAHGAGTAPVGAAGWTGREQGVPVLPSGVYPSTSGGGGYTGTGSTSEAVPQPYPPRPAYPVRGDGDPGYGQQRTGAWAPPPPPPPPPPASSFQGGYADERGGVYRQPPLLPADRGSYPVDGGGYDPRVPAGQYVSPNYPPADRAAPPVYGQPQGYGSQPQPGYAPAPGGEGVGRYDPAPHAQPGYVPQYVPQSQYLPQYVPQPLPLPPQYAPGATSRGYAPDDERRLPPPVENPWSRGLDAPSAAPLPAPPLVLPPPSTPGRSAE